MDKELFWELFRDTGDVTAWLLYRSAPANAEETDDNRGAEEEASDAS